MNKLWNTKTYSLLSLLSFVFLCVQAQVVIKDSIAIFPKPKTIQHTLEDQTCKTTSVQLYFITTQPIQDGNLHVEFVAGNQSYVIQDCQVPPGGTCYTTVITGPLPWMGPFQGEVSPHFIGVSFAIENNNDTINGYPVLQVKGTNSQTIGYIRLQYDYLLPPSVSIYQPYDGQVFALNSDYHPMIQSEAIYSPNSTLSWSPEQTIQTSSFYDTFSGDTLITVTATVTNTCFSAFDDVTFRVTRGNELAGFIVTADPVSISYQKCSSVTIQAVDEDGLPIEIDDNIELTISLSESGWGVLQGPEDNGEVITAKYGDIKYGIGFCSQGEKPTEPKQLIITAAKKSDPSKNGMCNINITPAVDHYTITAMPHSIAYRDTSTIYVQAKNADESDMDISDDTELMMYRSPQNFGWLELEESIPASTGSQSLTFKKAKEQKKISSARKDTTREKVLFNIPIFFSYGDAKNGRLKFIAQGDQPDSAEVIDLSVEQSDDPSKTGKGSVIVTKEETLCPVVSLSSSSLTPGDTTEVIIKGKVEDENGIRYVDYPAGQLFNVRLTAGENYGELLEVNTGRKLDNLTGAVLPIRFIGSDAIDADSVVFTVRAVPVVATQTAMTTASKSGEKITSAKTVYKEMATGECFPPTVDGTIIALDHFEVRLEQDTVAFTESAKLFVQAKNKNDHDVFLSDDAVIQLQLGGAVDYGTFIKPVNDTIWTSIVLFTLPYSDAKAGNVKLAAVKKNPSTVEIVTVYANLIGTTRKSGSLDVPVAEQTLKIVIEGDREVVPRNLVGQSRDPDPTDANKKEFKVQLLRNKAGVSNREFHLTVDYIDGSGGHDHLPPTYNRRTLNRDNYGYFIRKRLNNNTEHDSPYNGPTQDDGRETFDYVSSFFGDRMRLRVETSELNKKGFLWDTLSFAEKVDGLVQLGAGTDYNLIGGTDRHHGPGAPEGSTTPNNNHYAIANVRTNIQDIATEYHRQFPDEPVLQINDMSLPYGGRFDINGLWIGNSRHQYHRQGTDIDIKSTSIAEDDSYNDVNRNGRYDRGEPITFDLNENGQYDYTNRAFETICTDNDVLDPHLEYPGADNEHYHLYFRRYNR